MIKICNGDIFETDCDIIVCPVNCIGSMGKGLAKEFARRFPEYSRRYSRACIDGMIRPGTPVLHLFAGIYDKDIISFPTKDHWRNPSKLEYIENGLKSIARNIENMPHSIAFPALGCGCGELLWADVLPLMKNYLEPLEITCEIYEPK